MKHNLFLNDHLVAIWKPFETWGIWLFVVLCKFFLFSSSYWSSWQQLMNPEPTWGWFIRFGKLWSNGVSSQISLLSDLFWNAFTAWVKTQTHFIGDKFALLWGEAQLCLPHVCCLLIEKNMLYNKSLRSYSDVVVGKLEATLNISH